MSIMSHKNKIDDVIKTIQKNHEPYSDLRIGIYFGSFDPPHNGHLEVIDKVLNDYGTHTHAHPGDSSNNGSCDYVVMTTNHKNKAKPLLSDYYHRSIMIKNMIDDYHQKHKSINQILPVSDQILPTDCKIFFVEDDLKSIIKKMRCENNFHLIGIAGSDFYMKFSTNGRKLSLNFHEWLITPRKDFPIKDTETKTKNLNVKTTIMDENIFSKQHLSSSHIKKLIKSNPATKIDLEMCKRNQEYIYETKLYQCIAKS
jgi:nicotinic acid mononucleotide adenylyltransferase